MVWRLKVVFVGDLMLSGSLMMVVSKTRKFLIVGSILSHTSIHSSNAWHGSWRRSYKARSELNTSRRSTRRAVSLSYHKIVLKFKHLKHLTLSTFSSHKSMYQFKCLSRLQLQCLLHTHSSLFTMDTNLIWVLSSNLSSLNKHINLCKRISNYSSLNLNTFSINSAPRIYLNFAISQANRIPTHYSDLAFWINKQLKNQTYKQTYFTL